VPRIVRDARLENRTQRAKLKPRAEPYYRAVETGLHLGYRKGIKTGKWVVRRYVDGHYVIETLDCIADDTQDANRTTVLDYAGAVASARALHAQQGGGVPAGPYSVADAMRDYKADYEQRGGRGLRTVKSAIDARIAPKLGDIEVAKLTTAEIRDWHRSIANGARLVRGVPGKARKSRPAPPSGPDAKRRRQAAANRILTVLKAGLNFAFHEGKAASDTAWRKVKPFKDVDARTFRYLDVDELQRLVNGSAADFRKLVRGAILTGARYSELIGLLVDAFNAASGTVALGITKSGKPRYAILTDEGQKFFASIIAGRAKTEPMFLRADGKPWAPSDMRRPMAAACKAAKIEPPVGFHVLRHSHASLMAMRGVPLPVIGEQLGHADARMTKRYSHLSPNYVAETIRANFPTLGIVDVSKVAPMRRRSRG
jgi:integrase